VRAEQGTARRQASGNATLHGSALSRGKTSIGQNPFTETIYFRKYSVYEGLLGENTRLRELRRRLDFGLFWAIWGNFWLFGAVFA
jgi:hypothetical protein